MKKLSIRSAFFNPRALLGVLLFCVGIMLVLLHLNGALAQPLRNNGSIASPVSTIHGTESLINGAAYVRSENGGPPWKQTTNEEAMDDVLGAGNWDDLRYETLNPAVLFSSQYSFIYMEGSDSDADDLEAFLNANLTSVEDWVLAGGRLFINAAPNEGDGMAFPFGVTVTYDGCHFIDEVNAFDSAHPIFNGPFTAVGTLWTGSSFAHATLGLVGGANGGINPLIVGFPPPCGAPGNAPAGGGGCGDGPVSLKTGSIIARSGALAAPPTDVEDIVLGSKCVGRGIVVYGTMTTTNFHCPQPEASNLRRNIIDYTLHAPTETLYAADGGGGNPNCHLFILDPDDGSVIQDVGPIGFALTGLAFDPTTGILYGSTGNASLTSPKSLITVNPSTGAGTLVGSFSASGQTMADLTFTPDGTLYGWAEPSLDRLFTINTATGEATEVGPSNLSTFGSGMAANSSDVIYFAGNGDSGPLRAIDRMTGEPSAVVGLNGGPGGTISAMAFNSADTLFAADLGTTAEADGGSSPTSHLVRIDTSTGVITDLGQTIDRLDAIAFSRGCGSAPSPTPTPTPTPVPSGTQTPVVNVTVSPGSVNPGGDAIFVISDGNPAQFRRPVTVFYSMSGKARLGVHYTLSGTPGQVTIGPGEVAATVTLHAIAGGGSNNRGLPAKMILNRNAAYKLGPRKKVAVKILR